MMVQDFISLARKKETQSLQLKKLFHRISENAFQDVQKDLATYRVSKGIANVEISPHLCKINLTSSSLAVQLSDTAIHVYFNGKEHDSIHYDTGTDKFICSKSNEEYTYEDFEDWLSLFDK